MNEGKHHTYQSGSAGHAVLKVGSIHQFGVVDLGTVGLASGWAQPEEGHTWNDGCETVFECGGENLTGGCVVEFSGRPFFCEGVDRQDVYLHINGFRVGYWRLTEPREYVLAAKVETEQLFRRGDLSVMKCVWSFPAAVRPVDKGISADLRELAFCFRSFTILEA